MLKNTILGDVHFLNLPPFGISVIICLHMGQLDSCPNRPYCRSWFLSLGAIIGAIILDPGHQSIISLLLYTDDIQLYFNPGLNPTATTEVLTSLHLDRHFYPDQLFLFYITVG